MKVEFLKEGSKYFIQSKIIVKLALFGGIYLLQYASLSTAVMQDG